MDAARERPAARWKQDNFIIKAATHAPHRMHHVYLLLHTSHQIYSFIRKQCTWAFTFLYIERRFALRSTKMAAARAVSNIVGFLVSGVSEWLINSSSNPSMQRIKPEPQRDSRLPSFSRISFLANKEKAQLFFYSRNRTRALQQWLQHSLQRRKTLNPENVFGRDKAF